MLHFYGADSIMFDLEDAVSLKEKDSARVLVHSALKKHFDYSNVETVVRINGLDTTGALDIEAVVLLVLTLFVYQKLKQLKIS